MVGGRLSHVAISEAIIDLEETGTIADIWAPHEYGFAVLLMITG
jgi:hypothetical protein